MARLLLEGTGAERAEVWLRLGDAFRLEAWWPTTGSEGEGRDAPVTLGNSEVDVLDDGARR